MEKLQQKIQLALQHVLQKNHREDGILTKVWLTHTHTAPVWREWDAAPSLIHPRTSSTVDCPVNSAIGNNGDPLAYFHLRVIFPSPPGARFRRDTEIKSVCTESLRHFSSGNGSLSSA